MALRTLLELDDCYTIFPSRCYALCGYFFNPCFIFWLVRTYNEGDPGSGSGMTSLTFLSFFTNVFK